MKKRIFRLLILFSFILNIVFIYNFTKNSEKSNSLKLMDLKLTTEKKKEIEKLNQEYHMENENLKKKIYTYQKDLILMLDSEKPDEKKVSNCLDKISLNRKLIETIAVKKILRIKDLLDHDQCNSLISNLEGMVLHNSDLCDKDCCNPKQRGVKDHDQNEKKEFKHNQIKKL